MKLNLNNIKNDCLETMTKSVWVYYFASVGALLGRLLRQIGKVRYKKWPMGKSKRLFVCVCVRNVCVCVIYLGNVFLGVVIFVV